MKRFLPPVLALSAVMAIPAVSIGAAVTITTPPLPDGVVGKMYSQTLAASGGTSPYSWALLSGSGALPAGLTLSSAGVVSGTPMAAGSSTFTVQVTDSTPGQPLTATKSFTLRIDTPLSITTGNLTATVGVPFSQALAATGGVPPYVFTISSGSVPGLSLSSGVISGTPSMTGTFTVNLVVADSAVQTATKTITITVTSTANQISITTGNLSATVGMFFSQALGATGGTLPYTWSITSGSLPAGLSLNSGVISGTPTTAGTSAITLLVTDSNNLTASASITITVNSPQAPSVTVTVGTPGTPVGPSQQPPINISLSNTYPSAITITLTLAFQSAVGGQDQMVQFLPGGTQSLTLTVPAGSLTPSTSATLMTGTTAGTITITTALTAAGATLPAPAPTMIAIPKTNPVITKVTFSNTGGGLTVTVTGYSTTHDMVSGNFTFSPASGSKLVQSQVTVQLASAFATWYQNTASYAYGTEFLLTMPFTVSGSAADVTSVSVTLTNSFGTSSAASAP